LRCADSSLLVPALATWHEHHSPARNALRGIDTTVGHCLAETYSVLTRLPEPLRGAPSETAATIAGVVERVLLLDEADMRRAPEVLAAAFVSGGATYDGLIALTAIAYDATLVTMDRRASRTYLALGADYELVT